MNVNFSSRIQAFVEYNMTVVRSTKDITFLQESVNTCVSFVLHTFVFLYKPMHGSINKDANKVTTNQDKSLVFFLANETFVHRKGIFAGDV